MFHSHTDFLQSLCLITVFKEIKFEKYKVMMTNILESKASN